MTQKDQASIEQKQQAIAEHLQRAFAAEIALDARW
jgi:hypothetical protein